MMETETPETFAGPNVSIVPKGNPLELVPFTDMGLRTPLPTFDFDDPPMDPVRLAVDLIATMDLHMGLGLSANQVGLPHRVFVMRSYPNLVCFNPRIVDRSESETELEEGCLSFPGLVFKVSRPDSIRVRFQTPNGKVATKTFNGMTARVFCHELMHLDGRFPFEGISRMKLDRAIKDSPNRSLYDGKGLLIHAR